VEGPNKPAAVVTEEAAHRRVWRRLPSLSPGAVIVTVAFVLSRMAIHQAGVRFDARIDDHWQLLELGRLRSDLVGSLLNLHSQPPLFNLFVGLVRHAPEGLEVPLFHATYLAMGLALTLCLYAALRRLGVSAGLAAALTVVISCSPSLFLYEHWLHYDYPVTVLLCVAVVALLRHEDGHQLRYAGAFVAVLAALALTRSLFHLGWVLAWAVVLVVRRRRADWKRVAAVVAVPVVAVVAVYANVARVSGRFASSTSLGMSLAKVTTFQLHPAQRSAMVAKGQLSRLAAVEPFSPMASYRRLVPPRRPTGVAVLDEEMKRTPVGPRPNYNHIDYVEVSNRYMTDALRTIRSRPGAYVKGMTTALGLWFRPAGDYFALGPNRQKVAALERVYNVLWYGVLSGGEGSYRLPDPAQRYRGDPGRTAWLLILAYGSALVGGAAALWRGWRGRWRGPPLVVVGFLWSTLVYVMVVSNALEVGENNRLRLYTEPLVFLLLAALLVAWWESPSPSPARSDVSERQVDEAAQLDVRLEEALVANEVLRSRLASGPADASPAASARREASLAGHRRAE
jgi:hypothetical protein